MTTEFKAYPAYGGRQPALMVHDTEIANFEGRLAVKLLDHFALISASDAGEDSAGRKAFRLMEPNDVVVRACEIAEIMARALRVRGWIVNVPTIAEMEAQAAAQLKREDARV